MKLTQRILLLILVTVSLSTLANYLLTEYQEKSLHQDSEKILARTIIQSLRDALVQDVIDGNKLKVKNLLVTLKEHDNPIEFLYVTKGTRHSVFAHSFRKGFPRYLMTQDSPHLNQQEIFLSAKYQTSDGLIYEYSEPLINGLDMVLHIGINQSEIAQTLAKNRQSILLMSLFIAVVTLLLAYFWARQVAAPLGQLAEQIRRFGMGKGFNSDGIKQNIAEINLLSTAFEKAIKGQDQALKALEESKQDLEITLNSIGDAVIATDKEGNVSRMNPVASQLTGWSINEAKGLSLKSIFPIVDASTRKDIENPVDKVIATGETVYLSNHTTLIARDKTEYQIADSAAPIRNHKGEILGMVLVFNDVTEQYRMRQSIIESEKKYQTLAKIAPVGIFYTDEKGGCLYVNEKWCEITGISKQEAMGDGWVKSLHPDDLQRVFTQWNKAAEMNIPFKLEYRFKQAEKVCWVFGQALAEKNSNGEVVGYVGSITDITHRKEAEDKNAQLQSQLHLSQKMDALGKLTGGIAHDYNNMLGVVLGYTELLEDLLIDKPKLVSYIQKIRHAGERSAGLTKKLLRFAQPKVSNATLLSINAMLQEQQQMLEKTLTARITLEYKLQSDLWPVWLSSGDLEDTIINLSINALHAMEDSGRLTIKTCNVHLDKAEAELIQLVAGDYVCLSFTDTGCGMDETVLNKIFEPFFTTKGQGGSGLGLSQIYGFIESSNGVINVKSKPGRGSQFILYFPRYEKSLRENNIANSEVSEMDVRGHENILIVDDEPALLKLNSEILKGNGYNIFSANNATQALEVLEKESIDLLLSDVIMPGKNGFELAAIVEEKYPQIKIQIVSGYNDESHSKTVNEALNKNILHKPFSSQVLLERIRRLLDEKKP